MIFSYCFFFLQSIGPLQRIHALRKDTSRRHLTRHGSKTPPTTYWLWEPWTQYLHYQLPMIICRKTGKNDKNWEKSENLAVFDWRSSSCPLKTCNVETLRKRRCSPSLFWHNSSSPWRYYKWLEKMLNLRRNPGYIIYFHILLLKPRLTSNGSGPHFPKQLSCEPQDAAPNLWSNQL